MATAALPTALMHCHRRLPAASMANALLRIPQGCTPQAMALCT